MTGNPNLLDTLRERGFIDQVTEPADELRALLAAPACAYIGFDPTAPSLHVGSRMLAADDYRTR